MSSPSNSYRNQIVDADIVSSFLERPSDEAMMKLIGHVSLTRDPNAPAKPTSAQRQQIHDDAEVIKAKKLLGVSTKALRDRYSSIAAARRKSSQERKLSLIVIPDFNEIIAVFPREN
jgi:Protein of unknown function (DUF3435)